MRNLNFSGLIKLSLSSSFSESIPATASNPQGFPSCFWKCSILSGGISSSVFGFPVFGGVVAEVSHPEKFFPMFFASSVENFSSNAFIISVAFATQDCICVSEASSDSIESHFQSLVTALRNSGEVVTARKKASKPVSFEDIVWKLRDFLFKEMY